jgi:DNA-directed RNA polymerase specialized sigma24 family protein
MPEAPHKLNVALVSASPFVDRANEGSTLMIAVDTLNRAFLNRSAFEGEAKAQEFEAAALPHLHDLFRTATRVLSSSTEAEDIVQETYLLAWKSFDRFEQGTNCRAWLFTIMFNAVRHYRRRWFDRRATGETAEIL